jgi:hypothetical protein
MEDIADLVAASLAGDPRSIQPCVGVARRLRRRRGALLAAVALDQRRVSFLTIDLRTGP